ncbi:MAG: hypothetical protein KBA83_10030, partial [Fermentimonas sp.]|nr:hypothetical protein [Fermentimonas sp.]
MKLTELKTKYSPKGPYLNSFLNVDIKNKVVFSMLRSNRYTLELIRKENRYTMSFFDREYQEEIVKFGMSSGRDSNKKMTNTTLTAVETPSG